MPEPPRPGQIDFDIQASSNGWRPACGGTKRASRAAGKLWEHHQRLAGGPTATLFQLELPSSPFPLAIQVALRPLERDGNQPTRPNSREFRPSIMGTPTPGKTSAIAGMPTVRWGRRISASNPSGNPTRTPCDWELHCCPLQARERIIDAW